MKITLDKKAKHSVRVAVNSTTTGQELNTHDIDAGKSFDLSDFPDESQIVITRGAETPASDEAPEKE